MAIVKRQCDRCEKLITDRDNTYGHLTIEKLELGGRQICPPDVFDLCNSCYEEFLKIYWRST